MKIQTLENPLVTYVYKSDTFKEIVYSLQISIPIEAKASTKANLLSIMMRDRIQAYPTKADMLRARDMLYGARLSSQVIRYGELLMLKLSITTISDRFVEHPMIDNVLQLMSEVLYRPLLTEDVFKEAKKTLSSRLNRRIEQPMQYAINEGLKHFGQGNVVQYSSYGHLEDLDSITLDSIVDFHQVIIKASAFGIVVGDVDVRTLQTSLSKNFTNHPAYDFSTMNNLMHHRESQTLTLYKKVNQANLVKLFTTQVNVTDAKFFALHTLSIILGQLPTSLLFQEVREKRSLTYSIGSSLLSYDGMMMITTSLDEKNIETTNQLIHHQLQRMIEGDFDQELLDGALLMLQSSFDSIEDDIYSITNFIVSQVLLQGNFDLNDHLSKYQNVTKEDIQKISQNVQLLGDIHLVSKEDHHGNI